MRLRQRREGRVPREKRARGEERPRALVYLPLRIRVAEHVPARAAVRRGRGLQLLLLHRAVQPRRHARERGDGRGEAVEPARLGAAVDLDERACRLAAQRRGPVAQHVEHAREAACADVQPLRGGVPPGGQLGDERLGGVHKAA